MTTNAPTPDLTALKRELLMAAFAGYQSDIDVSEQEVSELGYFKLFPDEFHRVALHVQQRLEVLERRVRELEAALDQAGCCLRGETPEDCTNDDAREDTLQKIRTALNPPIASGAPEDEGDWKETVRTIYDEMHFRDQGIFSNLKSVATLAQQVVGTIESRHRQYFCENADATPAPANGEGL